MKVFLTGVTGYVGNEVLRVLLDRGHRVVALTRSRGGLEPIRDGVDMLLGDLGTPQGWEEAAATADAIVHCALEYTAGGDERPEVDAAAVSAYERAVGTGGKPVVYTSSLFECSRVGAGPIVESTPQENRDSWRLQHERRILEAIPGAAVLRLGFVYGGTGGYIWDLFAPGDDGGIAFAAGASSRWPFIHVEDLAELYLAILEKRASGIFHGTDDDNATVREVVGRIAEITGHPAKEVPASEAVERFGRIGGFMLRDVWSAAPRSRELGWRPRFPSFSSAALAAFRDYLATKKKSELSAGANGRSPPAAPA